MTTFVQAGRPRRLFAAMVDFTLTALVAFALMWPLGVFENEQAYERVQFVARLFTLAFGTYLLLNGRLLHKSGQTIGKKLFRIHAVKNAGEQILPLWKSLLRIFGIFALAAIVALKVPPMAALMFLAALIVVDGLFIFTGKRRCLHDYLVASKVQRLGD